MIELTYFSRRQNHWDQQNYENYNEFQNCVFGELLTYSDASVIENVLNQSVVTHQTAPQAIWIANLLETKLIDVSEANAIVLMHYLNRASSEQQCFTTHLISIAKIFLNLLNRPNDVDKKIRTMAKAFAQKMLENFKYINFDIERTYQMMKLMLEIDAEIQIPKGFLQENGEYFQKLVILFTGKVNINFNRLKGNFLDEYIQLVYSGYSHFASTLKNWVRNGLSDHQVFLIRMMIIVNHFRTGNFFEVLAENDPLKWDKVWRVLFELFQPEIQYATPHALTNTSLWNCLHSLLISINSREETVLLLQLLICLGRGGFKITSETMKVDKFSKFSLFIKNNLSNLGPWNTLNVYNASWLFSLIDAKTYSIDEQISCSVLIKDSELALTSEAVRRPELFSRSLAICRCFLHITFQNLSYQNEVQNVLITNARMVGGAFLDVLVEYAIINGNLGAILDIIGKQYEFDADFKLANEVFGMVYKLLVGIGLRNWHLMYRFLREMNWIDCVADFQNNSHLGNRSTKDVIEFVMALAALYACFQKFGKMASVKIPSHCYQEVAMACLKMSKADCSFYPPIVSHVFNLAVLILSDFQPEAIEETFCNDGLLEKWLELSSEFGLETCFLETYFHYDLQGEEKLPIEKNLTFEPWLQLISKSSNTQFPLILLKILEKYVKHKRSVGVFLVKLVAKSIKLMDKWPCEPTSTVLANIIIDSRTLFPKSQSPFNDLVFNILEALSDITQNFPLPLKLFEKLTKTIILAIIDTLDVSDFSKETNLLSKRQCCRRSFQLFQLMVECKWPQSQPVDGELVTIARKLIESGKRDQACVALGAIVVFVEHGFEIEESFDDIFKQTMIPDFFNFDENESFLGFTGYLLPFYLYISMPASRSELQGDFIYQCLQKWRLSKPIVFAEILQMFSNVTLSNKISIEKCAKIGGLFEELTDVLSPPKAIAPKDSNHYQACVLDFFATMNFSKTQVLLKIIDNFRYVQPI